MVVKDPAADPAAAHRDRSSRSTAPPDRDVVVTTTGRSSRPSSASVEPSSPAKGHRRHSSMDREVGPIETGLQRQSSADQQKKHRLKSRFQVVRKLGQGTYGKVQLAINKETGQEVAIKTIKKSKIESEQDLVRIRREIQIMSSIQHPHIIHIFEVFENKEKIVLVMQHASGGELYEYVSDRKLLTDHEARRVFRQIATAIYYCHKNQVCHRDLKLENILMDDKSNAKIGDFGLSNVFDCKHHLNTFCGSPLYASPEIVKGTPYFGPEVDCWSMGVLLYTLVYGAMPFDGSNFKRLVKQISEANYYEPKDRKSEASPLIRRLLCTDPRKRGTIVDICNDAWVNDGFDHSLLQVAEDMANLTPVRLDILLSLAPISPTIVATPSSTAAAVVIAPAVVAGKRSPAATAATVSPAAVSKEVRDNHKSVTTPAAAVATSLPPERKAAVKPIPAVVPSSAAHPLQPKAGSPLRETKSKHQPTAVVTSAAAAATGSSPAAEGKKNTGSTSLTDPRICQQQEQEQQKAASQAIEEEEEEECNNNNNNSNNNNNDDDSRSIKRKGEAESVKCVPSPDTVPVLDAKRDANAILASEKQQKVTPKSDPSLEAIVAVSQQPVSVSPTERKSSTATATTTSSAANAAAATTTTSTISESSQSNSHSPAAAATTAAVTSKPVAEVKPKPRVFGNQPNRKKPAAAAGAAQQSQSQQVTTSGISSPAPSSSSSTSPVSQSESPNPNVTRQQPESQSAQSSSRSSPPSKAIWDNNAASRNAAVTSAIAKSQQSVQQVPTTSPTDPLPAPAAAAAVKSVSGGKPAAPCRSKSIEERKVLTTSETAIESNSSGTESPSTQRRRRQQEEALEARRISFAKRVGRLSIPSFLELQQSQTQQQQQSRGSSVKKRVPSYGSIEEAKKKLLERADSVHSEHHPAERENVFPTIPVQEAKVVVERRASVADTIELTKGPSGIRFDTSSPPAEDRLIRGVPRSRMLQNRRSTEPLMQLIQQIKSSDKYNSSNSQVTSTVSSLEENDGSSCRELSSSRHDSIPEMNESSPEPDDQEGSQRSGVGETTAGGSNLQSISSNVSSPISSFCKNVQQDLQQQVQGEVTERSRRAKEKEAKRRGKTVKGSTLGGGRGEQEENVFVVGEEEEEEEDDFDEDANEEEEEGVSSCSSRITGSGTATTTFFDQDDEQHEGQRNRRSASGGGMENAAAAGGDDEEDDILGRQDDESVTGGGGTRPAAAAAMAMVVAASAGSATLEKSSEAAAGAAGGSFSAASSSSSCAASLSAAISGSSAAAGSVPASAGASSATQVTTAAAAPVRPAPITRSYKKVTFTKEGAKIMETGKVICQPGPDGIMTRIEKKSRVVHHPQASGGDAIAAAAAGKKPAESRTTTTTKTTTTTFGSTPSSSSFDLMSGSASSLAHHQPVNESCSSIPSSASQLAMIREAATQSPTQQQPLQPHLLLAGSSASSLRRSESASSSGSTDVFDDIFDTWSGDTKSGGFHSDFLSFVPSRIKSMFSGMHPMSTTTSSSSPYQQPGSPLVSASGITPADLFMRRSNCWRNSARPAGSRARAESASRTAADRRDSLNSTHSPPPSSSSHLPHPLLSSFVFDSVPTTSADHDNNNSSVEHSGSAGSLRHNSNRDNSRRMPFQQQLSSSSAAGVGGSLGSGTARDLFQELESRISLFHPTSSLFEKHRSLFAPQQSGKAAAVPGSDPSFFSSSSSCLMDPSEDPAFSSFLPAHAQQQQQGAGASGANSSSASLGSAPAAAGSSGSRIRSASHMTGGVASSPAAGSSSLFPGLLLPSHNLSFNPCNMLDSDPLSRPASMWDEDPVILPESSSLLDQLRTHGYRNLVNQRIAFPPDSFARKCDDLMPTPTPDCSPSANAVNSSSSSSNNNNNMNSSGSNKSPPNEESVRERIHRKSFYQRFNDDNATTTSLPKTRADSAAAAASRRDSLTSLSSSSSASPAAAASKFK